ncbi:hypothetical protein P3S67_028728 [Capsicum chacoense]
MLLGVLPERVFHLSNLEDLSLSYNSLTGPIPFNVSGLQNLKYLYLSANYMNGTIPSWVFSLPSLYLIDLISNNSFSGKILEFKVNNTLVVVSVKQNQLQGLIPKSLLDQKYLEDLILPQNNFSGQIASTLCDLKRLFLLQLGSNHLNGTIPHYLGQMSGLEVLGLNNNSLSGSINTTFNTENKIRIINLDGNKLKGNNELYDTFLSWLGGLPYLQILSLRSNKLHGPISYSRTDNLFAKIQVIDLSSNGFSGDLPVLLFENFQAMKIIGENSETREYIADNYSVYYMNTLIVKTKGWDREFFHVLKTNIIMNFSRNRFEGYLPRIIGDLVGLRKLILGSAQRIWSFKKLRPQAIALVALWSSQSWLNLCHNGLEVFNLSHNHLVGCIPKGKQFDTFENNSYQENDGICGFPLSKYCGSDDGVPQATTPVDLDEEEKKKEN